MEGDTLSESTSTIATDTKAKQAWAEQKEEEEEEEEEKEEEEEEEEWEEEEETEKKIPSSQYLVPSPSRASWGVCAHGRPHQYMDDLSFRCVLYHVGWETTGCRTPLVCKASSSTSN